MGNEVRLIDRTLSQIRGAWRELALRVAPGAGVRPGLSDDDIARIRRKIGDCLEGRGGAVSARARAADLGRIYLTLDGDGRKRFLGLLGREFGVDHAAVDAAIEAVGLATVEERERAEQNLRQALTSPRRTLFTQFNVLPHGIKFLVDLRGDVLQLLKEAPDLSGLDRDLRDLLASWFDIGFLDLARITWRSPAVLLEKLIHYEAVHEIRSWDDLKNRLDSDRRCFAFFHNRMPDEPLIFVEVALTVGLADDIHALLDQTAPARDPREADTAIFYSISNTQVGLTGISFGDFLIKRVVDELAREFPRLKSFATLSPVPGFLAWLEERIAAADASLLTAAEGKTIAEHSGATDGLAGLATALAGDWIADEALAEALKRPLLAACARYLLEERRQGRPRDPVVRFHLANGASIGRINWLADRSERGRRQSAGIMVNYVYDLAAIEENHEAYTAEGRIAAASAVRGLVRKRVARAS